MKNGIMCTAIFIVSCLLSTCGQITDNGNPDDLRPPDSHKPGLRTETARVTHDANHNQDSFCSADAILEEMTLEEKIGQMLFIAYRRDAAGNDVLAVDEYLYEILSECKPGGFVLFHENLSGIEQTVKLINDIQTDSTVPLFISIDEEGGIVTRLNRAPLLNSTVMPAAYEIGLTEDPSNAYICAGVIARELFSLGFNMDFAPVADLYTNPENQVIGKRAYGEDPASVSLMVAEAVKGFYDNDIIPVLKHFPGHGDTLSDPHTGSAEVMHDIDRFEACEIVPFKAGLTAGADAVMVAHILLPNIQTDPVPASLSKEIVTGILREKLGFEGVVMTDALEMRAISAYYSGEEAAVKAIDAGSDMLLMPVSAKETFKAILAAVRNGTLAEGRINESVRRILILKEKRGLMDGVFDRPDPNAVLGSPDHEAVAKKIRGEAGLK